MFCFQVFKNFLIFEISKIFHNFIIFFSLRANLKIKMKFLEIGFFFCLILLNIFEKANCQVSETNATEGFIEVSSNQTNQTKFDDLWTQLADVDNNILLNERKVDKISKFRNEFIEKSSPNVFPQVIICSPSYFQIFNSRVPNPKNPKFMRDFQILRLSLDQNNKAMSYISIIS